MDMGKMESYMTARGFVNSAVVPSRVLSRLY